MRQVQASRLFAGALLLVGLSGATKAQSCDAVVDATPTPNFKVANTTTVIGPNNEGYDRQDLTALFPIPLGVHTTDEDTIHEKCNIVCKATAIPGPWTVRWLTVPILNPAPGDTVNLGGFMTSSGDVAPNMHGADMVLYVPPDDLARGEWRQLTVRAVIEDPGSHYKLQDGDLRVNFLVNLLREDDDEEKYRAQVILDGMSSDPPSGNLACLQGAYEQCCFLYAQGMGRMDGAMPTAGIVGVSSPVQMHAGEVRPISVTPTDEDVWMIECGRATGSTVNCDPSSVFGSLGNFTDAWNFAWAVTAATANVHLVNPSGRTVLVQATTPGTATLSVTVSGQGGEISFPASITLDVQELSIESFSFSGHHEVYPDGETAAYPTPHWFDADGDGDASDVLQGSVGSAGDERRIPVAYTKGTTVALDSPVITSPLVVKGNPIALRAVARADTAMADTVEEHFNFTPAMRFVLGSSTYTGGYDAADLQLPNHVGVYDSYELDWKVSFTGDADDYYDIGTTDNLLYVLAAAPLNRYGPSGELWETVADTSCRAALLDPGSVPADLAAKVYSAFEDPVVGMTRKARNGWNKPDSTPLVYWNISPVLFPGISCAQGLGAGLIHPSGDTSCKFFSEFLGACLEAQGVDDWVSVEIRGDAPAPPPPNAPTYNMLVKKWEFVDGPFIDTGADGIRQTMLVAPDVEVIKHLEGKPHSVAVRSPLGFFNLISPHFPDDKRRSSLFLHPVQQVWYDIGWITAGEDGIIDSQALAPDTHIPPTHTVGEGGSPQRALAIRAKVGGTLQSTPLADDNLRQTVPGIAGFPYVINETAHEVAGVYGQRNPNPPAAFKNHYVVRFPAAGGDVFDPSYGLPPMPESVHRVTAFAGYGPPQAPFPQGTPPPPVYATKSVNDIKYH